MRLVAAALAALLCACSSETTSGDSLLPDAGVAPDAGAAAWGDAGLLPGDAGDQALARPEAVCELPEQARLADTSTPRRVVGDGTPQSCTEAALREAFGGGGVITFACGPAFHTIELTEELVIDNHADDVVLDGEGRIGLSGARRTRILRLDACEDPISPRCDLDPRPRLTVQRMVLRDGLSLDEVPDTKSTETGGGAIFRRGGSLTVVDCDFVGNRCDPSGQDVSGGAITSQLGQEPTVISGCNFVSNSCANGGAVGALHSSHLVLNSRFELNEASGSGGNRVPDGSHPEDTGGNGGNGGALVIDGQNNPIELCGVRIERNLAHYAGSAIFRTGYNSEPFLLERSVVDSNELDRLDWPESDHDHYNAALGTLYLQGISAKIERTSIARNRTNGGAAGIFAADHGAAEAVVDLTNVTIAENEVAGGGLGGALFGGGSRGRWSQVTVARNRANFAGAFFGGAGLTLHNSLIADNHRDDADSTGMWNPNSCFCVNCSLSAEGSNLQWPRTNLAGKTDEPACAPGITFSDPKLGALEDREQAGRVAFPAAGGPAIGVGNDCPLEDQLGRPRPATGCTLGAVELP